MFCAAQLAIWLNGCFAGHYPAAIVHQQGRRMAQLLLRSLQDLGDDEMANLSDFLAADMELTELSRRLTQRRLATITETYADQARAPVRAHFTRRL